MADFRPHAHHSSTRLSVIATAILALATCTYNDSLNEPFQQIWEPIMMSFRRTMSVAALAWLAGGAAGCGSGSAAPGPSNGAPNEASRPAALSPGQQATGAPIKVGYINQQGGSTFSAPEYTEGAELAVSYVNGHLNGFGGHPVQLVRCYTDGTPASSAACANQMVDDKVPLVIQGQDSNTASVPILAKAGIPYVVPNGVGPSESDTPGVFTLTVNLSGGIAGMAKYASDRGWRKVALLALDLPSESQSFQKFTGPVYAKAGVRYQLIYVPPGTPDQTPQVSAAMSGHPDAILFAGDVNTCTSFLKAVAALGVTTPVFLVGSCAGKSVLASVPATALENAYVLSSVDLSNTGTDAQTFETLLRQQDPNADPQSIRLRLGYLSVVTLARILKGFTGDPTAENLMTAIRSANDVPLPFGRGAVVTCNGTAIPGQPSVCSPNTLLLKVQGPDEFAFVNVFNVAPLFAP
jgi:branched-chain amino acid transport system substrate-binding protein